MSVKEGYIVTKQSKKEGVSELHVNYVYDLIVSCLTDKQQSYRYESFDGLP
jgi:hypothetical protein